MKNNSLLFVYLFVCVNALASHLINPSYKEKPCRNTTMKISYELNPPKILIDEDHFDVMRLNQELQILLNRSSELMNLVNGIHLTDSVLGIPRVSSITAASYIRQNTGTGERGGCSSNNNNNNELKLSCSVRTRDRNFTSFCQFVTDAILVGVESLLILRGDEPAITAVTAGGGGRGGIRITRREEDVGVGQKSSGLKPTSILSILNDKKYNKSIHLNLSVPSKIFYHNRSLFEKKIEAKPYSLVTQLISSLSDLGEIVDIVKSFKIKVVACVMVPSDKNRRSADIIGLDWKEYEKNPVDFIKAASTLADEVLISSPNSFRMGIDLLKSLRQ
jgi:5,10-methylenetetrahydrofolate reductase